MKFLSKTIAVVGLNSIGFPLALSAGKAGYSVIGIDSSSDKIDFIRTEMRELEIAKKRRVPFYPSNDFGDLRGSEIVLIAIEGSLEESLDICRYVALHLSLGQVLVFEAPLFDEEFFASSVLPIFENVSGLSLGKDFHLACSREGEGSMVCTVRASSPSLPVFVRVIELYEALSLGLRPQEIFRPMGIR